MKFLAWGLAQQAPSKQELIARGHQLANTQVHTLPRGCQVGAAEFLPTGKSGRPSPNRPEKYKACACQVEGSTNLTKQGLCLKAKLSPVIRLPSFNRGLSGSSSHLRCFHHPFNNESPAISVARPCHLSQQSLSHHDTPATRAGLVSLITPLPAAPRQCSGLD